jgi:3-phosphoshikimate 1-carboxyvinyltransferase
VAELKQSFGQSPREIPSGGAIRGRVAPPPSKSVTHRYLNLSLLAGAPAVVRRPLLAEDTRLFLDVLRALGWSVDVSEDAAELVPPGLDPDSGAAPAAGTAPDTIELFCGNAGTLFRFLTATLAVLPGRFRVDGAARLRERPVGPLVDALEALGVEVESIDGAPRGHAPLSVRGPSLAGGRATLDAGESSQYLSALLMACLRAERPTEILVPALTSGPYVELTRRAIRRFTPADRPDPIRTDGDTWHVAPVRLSPPTDLTVEGDWSAACYPAAAAAITGGRVELAGLDPDSAQGDRSFLDLLARMGARVSRRGGDVVVEGGRGGRLRAVEVDLSGSPDQVPTLAAVAPFASGTTRIYNISHLRIKESDRLQAMAAGLSRLGVPVEELPDGLVIEGCWADGVPDGAGGIAPVTIDPVGDHRIAMSFALVGLRRPGTRVADPEVVAKSYPRFWHDFESLLG